MKKKMFYGADKIIFGNAKSLRSNLTEPEMILWGRLKESITNYKFRRQHPIANWVVDFYCHRLKLVIEVDGSVHHSEENQKLDELRQRSLENLGLIVFRFTNEDVCNNIEKVLEKINEFIKGEVTTRRLEIFSSKIKLQTKFPLQGDRGYEGDCRLQ